MYRRANPPRRVRRKLYHDGYIYGTEVASAVTPNSSIDGNSTARATSQSESESESPLKFIVALDFGTTNTSVSYIKFDPEKPPSRVRSADIKSICAWPDAPSRNNRTSAYDPNVPSESWYRDGEYIWGYSVQRRILERPGAEFEGLQDVIKFSKLLLNEDTESSSPLNELLRKINKTVQEVITDYLTQVFTHTKKKLIAEESFRDSCAVELVLCIPAGWSIAAQRDMQAIMWDVTKQVDFGHRDFEPFIIHEPEAAAAHLLESTDEFVQLVENETFIICDAGGGTVDAITYRVTQVNPYRFEEVVEPEGYNCGSSRINEQMIQEATERLKDNELLKKVQQAPTEYIIHQEILNEFEYKIKTEFTFEEYRGRIKKKIPLRIVGLQQDEGRDLGEHIFYFTSERLARHFRESIEGTIELLSQQKEAAADRYDVKKMILVGGFSSSDALQKRVQEEFPDVEVIQKPINMSTVVSHGAVFRALNKKDGPERKIKASLGVLQHEIYDPNLKAHLLSSDNRRDGMDGKPYVLNVIEWLIRKNRKLGKQASYRRVLSQLFEIDEKWIVRQRIYASLARVVRNHYHCEDEVNNAGAEIAGVVVANLDEYRENGLIPPKRVEETDKEYFQVDYEIVLEVDGRNIRAKLFYPPGQECRDELKICIAAYFVAGTE